MSKLVRDLRSVSLRTLPSPLSSLQNSSAPSAEEDPEVRPVCDVFALTPVCDVTTESPVCDVTKESPVRDVTEFFVIETLLQGCFTKTELECRQIQPARVVPCPTGQPGIGS